MRSPVIPELIPAEVRAAIFKPLPDLPPISPAYERVAKAIRTSNSHYEAVFRTLMKANRK